MDKLTKSEAARLNGKKGGRPRKTPATILGGDAEPIATAMETHAETQNETHETQEPTETHETHGTHQSPVEVLDAVENPYGLTTRELLFVEAYCGVAGGNATEAYRMAGFKSTPSSAGPNAGRLIKRDRVAKAIAARTALRVRKLIMDGDEALERISTFARADMRKLFPPDHPIAKLPPEVAACIKSVTPGKYGTRLELIDPLRANELMAKATGKLKETVKVEHTLEEIMALANKPAELQQGAA